MGVMRAGLWGARQMMQNFSAELKHCLMVKQRRTFRVVLSCV